MSVLQSRKVSFCRQWIAVLWWLFTIAQSFRVLLISRQEDCEDEMGGSEAKCGLSNWGMVSLMLCIDVFVK